MMITVNRAQLTRKMKKEEILFVSRQRIFYFVVHQPFDVYMH